jgi:ribosomal 30S subunit maturation factor RimM
MKKKTKHTLLKGEGTNQHTLYGQFKVEEVADFPAVIVEKDSVLKHEQPDGSFSNEHKGLQIEVGKWSMGKQVEYNPFEGRITQVWD